MFYLSGKKEVVGMCTEIMRTGGLSVSAMEAEIGQASALKMGYSVKISLSNESREMLIFRGAGYQQRSDRSHSGDDPW